MENDMNKIDENIKGREVRCCCEKDCKWCDNQNNGKRYGIYLPPGKYYCPEHARERENLIT